MGSSPAFPAAPAAGSQAGDVIVEVALSYQGRRKMVRHGAKTKVGQLMELHPSLMRSGKALVIVDAQGFEVGNELTLAALIKPGSSIVELTVQADEW